MDYGEFSDLCDVEQRKHYKWMQRKLTERTREAARLQRERDEAERTIGALKHRIGEQTDEIAEANARADEAVRVAVWAAVNSSFIDASSFDGVYVGWIDRGECQPCFEKAASTKPSDIYRALRDAMGGEGGGSDGRQHETK